MTLYLVFPLWAPVALFGTGVLAVLLAQQRHRLGSLAHQFNCKMRS